MSLMFLCLNQHRGAGCLCSPPHQPWLLSRNRRSHILSLGQTLYSLNKSKLCYAVWWKALCCVTEITEQLCHGRLHKPVVSPAVQYLLQSLFLSFLTEGKCYLLQSSIQPGYLRAEQYMRLHVHQVLGTISLRL